MIAPASPADPCPDVEALVEFHVDPRAEPGNVNPALARLLIDLDRRGRTADSENETGGPGPAARSDVSTL